MNKIIKSSGEYNKPVWVIKRKKDDKIIEKFRSKNLADKYLAKKHREEFTDYFIERDNSRRFKK